MGIKKRKSRNYGHQQGLKTIEKIVDYSIKKKISYLTYLLFQVKIGKDQKKKLIFI